ncbi:uncharacterized protein LOC113306473 [Papaver somniferum]|uniref:uncharacterized protein LOC113306473 n=1 Tax=Papaver somniferum TaxID=3469 RepID=UPI000E703074|nr:uncharacterized protein LOC113306473 [Papaver somniferum]
MDPPRAACQLGSDAIRIVLEFSLHTSGWFALGVRLNKAKLAEGEEKLMGDVDQHRDPRVGPDESLTEPSRLSSVIEYCSWKFNCPEMMEKEAASLKRKTDKKREKSVKAKSGKKSSRSKEVDLEDEVTYSDEEDEETKRKKLKESSSAEIGLSVEPSSSAGDDKGKSSRVDDTHDVIGSPVHSPDAMTIGDSLTSSAFALEDVDVTFTSKIASIAQLSVSDPSLSQLRGMMLNLAHQSSVAATQSEWVFASELSPKQHIALEYLNICRNITQIENYSKAVGLLRTQAGKFSSLQAEVSNLQGDVSLLQKDPDRLEGESTANANWPAMFRAQNTMLLEVFNLSDLAAAANLEREALPDHFNYLREEFDMSKFEVDDIEYLRQKYEILKFNFRKSIAIIESLRSRVCTLKGDAKILKEDKETLSTDKDKIVEDGVKSLQDCRDENLELHAIIEKIRDRLNIEENEKNLKAELSELREKFEKSQQELETIIGDGGSSSHQVAELTNRLALVNDDLVQTRNGAEEYKERMDASDEEEVIESEVENGSEGEQSNLEGETDGDDANSEGETNEIDVEGDQGEHQEPQVAEDVENDQEKIPRAETEHAPKTAIKNLIRLLREICLIFREPKLEKNEKNLKAELSELREKFEKSQQELETIIGDGGSSSHQVAELTNRLALVNDELVQTRNGAEEYKERMDASDEEEVIESEVENGSEGEQSNLEGETDGDDANSEGEINEIDVEGDQGEHQEPQVAEDVENDQEKIPRAETEHAPKTAIKNLIRLLRAICLIFREPKLESLPNWLLFLLLLLALPCAAATSSPVAFLASNSVPSPVAVHLPCIACAALLLQLSPSTASCI